jgi:hypothetical protein
MNQDLEHLKLLSIFHYVVAGVIGLMARIPHEAEYQSTNLLIKRDRVWKAVASHVSGYKKR